MDAEIPLSRRPNAVRESGQSELACSTLTCSRRSRRLVPWHQLPQGHRKNEGAVPNGFIIKIYALTIRWDTIADPATTGSNQMRNLDDHTFDLF